MQVTYKAPKYRETAFNCPVCSAYAKQDWVKVYRDRGSSIEVDERLVYSLCNHCWNKALWFKNALLDPDISGAPPAHNMLPSEAASDYEEARSLALRSPRSAAALLRLCLQKVCNILGEPTKTIGQNIALMVSKGLPVEVQRALDIVRVIGNEQVHPGTLDLRDNPDIVFELFTLINFIVEDRIARPATIKELYDKLPSSKREGIEARDRKALGTEKEAALE